MKYLPIFALLLMFACCDEKPTCYHPCPLMEVSDASPVQFWRIDCDTYNESVPDGVHYKCFCHPWKCDDEIKVPITELFDLEYYLRIDDEDGNTLDTVDFIESTQVGSNILAGHPFEDWQNDGGSGTAWATGPTPSITLVGISFSQLLEEDVVMPAGTYTVDFSLFRSTTDINATLRFYSGATLVETETITPVFGTGTITDSFILQLTQSVDRVAVFSQNGAVGSRSLTMISLAINKKTFSYVASFVPSDLGICEQKIQLYIVESTASPDAEEAKSDCLHISDLHPDPTVLYEYSNNRNFAGIIYEDLSPVQTFQIRVPAVFFHEQFPEEDEAIELSDSKIINLNGVVRAQRLFDTAHMPYYMHRKMKLIFKHQTLLTPIDDKYWTKQDAYEIQEGNRTWPLKKAKCWLTERDFVQRNVV